MKRKKASGTGLPDVVGYRHGRDPLDENVKGVVVAVLGGDRQGMTVPLTIPIVTTGGRCCGGVDTCGDRRRDLRLHAFAAEGGCPTSTP